MEALSLTMCRTIAILMNEYFVKITKAIAIFLEKSDVKRTMKDDSLKVNKAHKIT